jgi:anti-sigma factor RsiW
MHAVVMESLEEYLSDGLGPVAQRDIEAHLSTCEMCREELASMREVSRLLTSLGASLESTGEATGEALEPAPGFYTRVMGLVRDRKTAPSFAGFFSLDLAFGRRLAFASLLTLAILGGYLVSNEAEYSTGLSPEAVMAQQDSPAFDSARAQDNMLVTLTTYEP